MARLSETVVLRNPSGAPEVLRTGSEVPEWASGKLGPHVLSEDLESDTDTDESDAENPEEPEAEDEQPPAPESDRDTGTMEDEPPAEGEPVKPAVKPARRSRSSK